MSWFDDGGNGVPLDVVALMDSQVPLAMAQVAAAGALVSFGVTSDGGAIGITVTLDGRWKRGYFRTVEEAHAWLEDAVVAVSEEAERLNRSAGPRGRRRRSRDAS